MILPRFLLLLAAACIFSLGIIMIFDTTSAEILDLGLEKNLYQSLVKQLIYAVIGGSLAFGMWKLGYVRFIHLSPYLLAFFTFLLVLTFVPQLSKEVNGSRRWISIAGFSLQPSEFVKYIIPAYFIHCYQRYENTDYAFKDFLKIVGIVAIPMFLILIEPNNGTVGVIAITLLILFTLVRVPVKYWVLPLIICAVLGTVSALNLPYVQARLKVYWNPELDLQGKGHQPHQAKIAAGSGMFWGKGPGQSLQKLSYLPEAQNDYIAAIFAEEFGFIGIFILICLYMVVALMGFMIANQAQDTNGFYIASCITFLICFQAFLNLGVVSGLLPSTGLNLPLFSQGGSSLMANMMGLSLLLSVSKRTKGSFFTIPKVDETPSKLLAE